MSAILGIIIKKRSKCFKRIRFLKGSSLYLPFQVKARFSFLTGKLAYRYRSSLSSIRLKSGGQAQVKS